MDLAQKRTTQVHPQDLSWLYTLDGVFGKATEGNITIASIASAAAIAKHWPDGFIKPGTLLGLHNSGTYNGTYSPYIADQSPDTGLTDVDAVLLTGGQIKRYDDGTYSVGVTCSIFLAELPLQVYVSKLPALLNNAGANRAVIAGDLPAAWVNMDG